jgi:signal transduction histidine kinase
VTISLSSNDEAVRLAVSDDGKGLPATRRDGQGIGLQVMKHRAGVIDAELKVESKPGSGVTVSCSFRRNKR